MTAATALKPSPIEKYKQEILPPDRAADLYRSLASHIRPEVFERNLINCLMANPDLLKYDARLVYREVSKAAGLGLLLDPQLGEAYLLIAYNFRSKTKEPQLRVGYKGMCKLARQTGGVTTIRSHEVCAKDDVKVDFGFPKELHIRPHNLFADRGETSGYIAVIEFKDGSYDFDAMSVEQCQAIRDRSDAWKAFKSELIKSTPWATDEVEMSKKTVLRRLLKRQDQSPELRRAIEIEDEAEFPTMREVRHIAAVKTPPIPTDDAPEAETKRQSPQTTLQKPKQSQPTAGGKKSPTPPEPPHDADGVVIPVDDPEAFLTKWLPSVLDQATSDTLVKIWNEKVEPHMGKLLPPDQSEAVGVFRKYEKKLAP